MCYEQADSVGEGHTVWTTALGQSQLQAEWWCGCVPVWGHAVAPWVLVQGRLIQFQLQTPGSHTLQACGAWNSPVAGLLMCSAPGCTGPVYSPFTLSGEDPPGSLGAWVTVV